MKIQREVEVTLTADELRKIVRDYLAKEGLDTDIGSVEFRVTARTTGYGRGEHTEYEFGKCIAKCKIVTERNE